MPESYAEDGCELPDTWVDCMEAIIAGTVDHDQIGNLILRCAEAADITVADAITAATAIESVPPLAHEVLVTMTPGWMLVARTVAHHLHGRFTNDQATEMRRMAQAADHAIDLERERMSHRLVQLTPRGE